MSAEHDKLVSKLTRVVSRSVDRTTSLQQVADLIRRDARFRWVGLYEVDRAAEVVRNMAWSGIGPPEYPTFPVTKGLTGAAIAERRIVNVGDVSADTRYLVALSSTRSEIIVPVFDRDGTNVVGTIDIESERPNAFDAGTQDLLWACSEVIRPLWGV